ncbi:hypothetical protein PVK06_008470 [Gossypium arboreum]|uniref:Secreted protein n=1 Tax=Gossypium arboreum TaxID=29729 RepID=A0ABR0QK24_GOSAR|nr:hypothetical protein PVK06_008470 [Gossypium arboreum]
MLTLELSMGLLTTSCQVTATHVATPSELPAASVDPLEFPVGPITRARAKRFKDAISALVDRAWAESITSLIESSWTSSPSHPRNLFLARPTHNQLSKFSFSLTSSHLAQLQLMSLFSVQLQLPSSDLARI